MLKNFWHNTCKRHEPTRTQATHTLKNQRDAMVSAFTTMLDNNKPPPPPKKPPDEDDSDEEEKKFKLTKMIEIMLHNGATVADIILNLSHSAIATTINIAELVNQIAAGHAQSSSSSSNEIISVHSSPPITVHSSSSESPTEIPAPTEDEEEEPQKYNFEKLKAK